MRKSLIAVVVVLLGMSVGVFAQETAPSGTTSTTSTRAATDGEAAALKKQLEATQAQLAKATAEQREKQARENFGKLAGAARKQLEVSCAANGAKWAFMQASLNGTVTTFVGCVGK